MHSQFTIAASLQPTVEPVVQESPWFILGAGAIGCLFAACLQRAGVQVALILRDDAAMASRQRRKTITLQQRGISKSVDVPAYTASQLPGNVTRVLICTKAHQTEAAVAALTPALTPDAQLVLLQNGMGMDALLRSQCPQTTILHALTTEGAYLTSPFSCVHAGRGETFIGSAQLQQDGVIAASAAHALRCELPIAAVADIQTRLWRKLAVNCVINPLTALSECTNGQLLQQPGILTTTEKLCAELSAVANASGQSLQSAQLVDQVIAVMQSTAANRSSMLQDIQHKRRSEVDFISGYVVQEGGRLGITCPANEALWAAIKDKEHKLGCR